MKRMHRFACAMAGLLMVAATATAQVAAPEYKLHANKLRHKSAGGYEIEVAPGLKYLGARRFHIRTAADAEVHLFAEYGADHKITKLAWIQVESQLPGQDWQYDYPSPDRTKLGDLEFVTDSAAFPEYHSTDPTSDHAVVDDMIRKKGLVMVGPVMRVRMIYLPDAERRRELMVIYAVSLPQSYSERIDKDGSEGEKFPQELTKVKAEAARDVHARIVK